MKFKSNKLILIFFIIFTLIFISFDKTILASFSEGEEILRGKVVEVVKEEPREDEFGEEIFYQQLKVYINSGSLKDKTIDLENGKFASVFNLKLEEGDKIFISYNPEIDHENQFQVEEYDRSLSLLLLFAIFVIISVAVAGVSGLKSLIGLGISFVIIIKLLIPFLASGANPIIVSLFCALLIGFTTFYISHGVSKKTTIALTSTFFALLFTAILGSIFIYLSKLTGASSEEIGFIISTTDININISELILAGIIIGTLGVLDDITISQAAVVAEIKSIDSNLSKKDLFKKGMNVGKDHIASLINTLVLVYTGGALPLLLLFSSQSSISFIEGLNMEIITEEIIITLSASIGLIIAVPITTILAAKFVDKASGESHSHQH